VTVPRRFSRFSRGEATKKGDWFSKKTRRRAPFGDTIRRKLTRKRLSVAPSCAQTAGNRKTPEFFVVPMSFGFIRRQLCFVIDVV